MRDTSRVHRITALIQEIWELRPDLKYFQVIDWLHREFLAMNKLPNRQEFFKRDENGNEIKFIATDLFEIEDDKLEGYLKQVIKEFNRRD